MLASIQRRFAPVLLVALLLGSGAAAQLDLPDRKVRDSEKREDVRPADRHPDSLRGRVLGEEGKAEDPLSLPHERRGESRPGAGAAAGAGAGTPEGVRTPAGGAEEPSQPGTGRRLEYVFDELARVRDIDDPLVDAAVRSLSDLGPDGRIAARIALAEEHAPTLMAGILTLMAGGSEGDWQFVADRVMNRLPANAAPGICERVIEADPVRASPRFLVRLLDHPQGAVRAVAQRRLEEIAAPEHLALLEAALDARRTDTRMRAHDIAAGIDSPERLGLLLRALKDPSAKIAFRAGQTLAGMEADEVVDPLLQRAFQSRWILRESAYALLTLMVREDLLFETHLTEAHVDALLSGLSSSDSFVSGTCAAALAGIGFKSATLEADWLAREVPYRLVRSASGLDFHTDFSSLQRTAMRRLALIAGVNYGSDGPAWVEWWTESSTSFRPRRAWLDATAEEADRVVLRFQSSLVESTTFELVGAEYARRRSEVEGATELPYGATFVLSVAQSADLFDLLDHEGVLGPDRLPGSRGPSVGPGRALEVGFDERQKSFRFAGETAESWFERVAATALALRDQNVWQRYIDLGEGGSRFERWRLESTWWEEARPETERRRRLKRLVLAWLPDRPPSERGLALEELRRLYREPDVAEPGDFAPLVVLLRQERFLGDRARILILLAKDAARAASPAPAEGAADDSAEPRAIPAELASDLLEAVLEAFGPAAAPELAEVLRHAGRDQILEATRDERPFVRAVAATTLSEDPRAEDLDRLRELLRDPVEDVEIATIRAIASAQVEGLSTELLVRARVGRPAVRREALRAIGQLGPPAALDVLVLGLRDEDLEVQAAAAEGLATLGDPSVTPLLVGLLSSSRNSALYAAAREGLVEMGQTAWPELLRVLYTPGHPALRDATVILARQSVPDAVPVLLRLLTDQPDDASIAWELAVLTAIDQRGAPIPAEAWWNWWDQVVHDDAWAWLRAALLREGVEVPPAEALANGGSREGALFLWRILGRSEPHLVERARRELSVLFSADLGDVPPPGPERDAWRYTLRESILERW